MTTHDLAATARALVAPGKGILAADESAPTIKKRFDSIQVESNEENRRNYREMLFTTEGASEHVSGVILFDETLRQATRDGTPFAKLLADKGADIIVANDVSAPQVGFGHDTNAVTMVTADGRTVEVPLATKRQVAAALFDLVVEVRSRTQQDVEAERLDVRTNEEHAAQ